MGDITPKVPLRIAINNTSNQKIVSVNPLHIKILGSVSAGYLFSKIAADFKRNKGREFYKTNNDFCAELRMGLQELKNAKKRLEESGVINIVRRGLPAKSYYMVNRDRLDQLIVEYVRLDSTALYQKNLVSFKPIYIDIAGSLPAGYLLSKLKADFERNNNEEFNQTDKGLCAELGISLKQLGEAKKRLKKTEIITVKRKCIPAKSFYSVDLPLLYELLQGGAK